jgi:hypothetical protein
MQNRNKIIIKILQPTKLRKGTIHFIFGTILMDMVRF